MKLNGLHHITAITGDAPRNVDFYTRVLGLRLVAKSVNQDDPSVYHLFYGDEQADPGADLTFFEYPGAIPGRPGAGMVHRIVSRVGGPDALEFWRERLGAEGVETGEGDDGSVRFSDPEGLDHELVVTDAPDEPLIAEHPEIPAEHALQGFEGVRAYSAHADGSAAILERFMNAERRETPAAALGAFECRGETRGGWIAFDEAPAEAGRQSGGSVHHVAWGSTTHEAHMQWLENLNEAGIQNSGYVDRHYFESIYFREPGGVLYELATDAPGFTVDGLPVEELGTKIILPPWLEDERPAVEAKLTPLPDPRASWPVS
jgi:glyoxalase family protein